MELANMPVDRNRPVNYLCLTMSLLDIVAPETSEES